MSDPGTPPILSSLPINLHNVQAELSVVGGMLIDPCTIPDVRQIVSSHDFYDSTTRQVFVAVLDLYDSGGFVLRPSSPGIPPTHEIDFPALLNLLEPHKKLFPNHNIQAWVGSIVDSVPTSANTTAYARTVAQKATLRQIHSAGLQIARDVTDRSVDLASVLQQATSLLQAARARFDKQAVEVETRCLADVESQPIDWLWRYRIAARKITVIAGDPGLGKSQATLSFAATVTTGGTWPDGTRCEEPGNVILITGEDDAGDTIKPRMQAAGADVRRVHILDAVRDSDGKGGKRRRGFSLESDIIRLESLIKSIGGVRLVVIDPISAYMGKADSHKNSDVRALLAPLAELAATHGCAVLVVTHMAKSGTGAMASISGSLGLIAAARAGYVVARHPTDPSARLFVPAKNNIGNDASGFAYNIAQVIIDSGIETTKIIWQPGVVTITADEALAASRSTGGEKQATDNAVSFLEEMLRDGPVPSTRIISSANQSLISRSSLEKAKELLGVKVVKAGFKEGWVWTLPPRQEARRTHEDATW